MRVGVQGPLRIQAHQLEQLVCRACTATLRELLHLSADQHRRVEAGERILVNHGDLVATQGLTLFGRHRQEVLTLVENLAGNIGVLVQEAGDCQSGNRLARP